MRSRSPRRTVAFVILIGIIGLIPLMRKARFQEYHTVNVWQLLASGACFCAGLLLLGKRKPSAEDSSAQARGKIHPETEKALAREIYDRMTGRCATGSNTLWPGAF